MLRNVVSRKVSASDTEAWVEVEFELTDNATIRLKDDYRSANGTFRVRHHVTPSVDSDGKPRSESYAYEAGNRSETLFYGRRTLTLDKSATSSTSRP